MKKINFKDKKILSISILILLILAATIYKFGFAKNSEVTTIQEIAKEYLAQNKNYGFETKPGELTGCISRNTFLRNDKIMQIFSAQDLTDASCKFKVENNMVTAWSVSLIKGEKVYCGDSTGANTVTPGITTTPNCKGE